MADNERRLKLHEELVSILGSRNVYFQPPESVKLKYPCIIYTRQRPDTIRADDRIYRDVTRYQITFITKDPEDKRAREILYHFQMISASNEGVTDNLYHHYFDLYY
jgi:hypothetical protein